MARAEQTFPTVPIDARKAVILVEITFSADAGTHAACDDPGTSHARMRIAQWPMGKTASGASARGVGAGRGRRFQANPRAGKRFSVPSSGAPVMAWPSAGVGRLDRGAVSVPCFEGPG
jgi:hypothetical protein